MTMSLDKTNRLHAWLHSASGAYLLAWEQAQVDAQVVDMFGYHALQLGWGGLDALRSNRMPHRWLAHLAHDQAGVSAVLVTDAEALPFPDASLDLVILPHTLELSADPHATLREVERVLVAEGRVVILGFNPFSLWGVRKQNALGLPQRQHMMGLWRLKDWLRLLSFEMEEPQLGCYCPPLQSARWLQRLGWMDRLGARWWAFLGGVYCVVAVKRVRGTRLLGPLKKRVSPAKARVVSTAVKEMK